MDSLLAGNLILPLEGSLCRYDVQRRCAYRKLSGEHEHDSGLGRKPFALTPESLFAFTPESFSRSPRNPFRLRPESAVCIRVGEIQVARFGKQMFHGRGIAVVSGHHACNQLTVAFGAGTNISPSALAAFRGGTLFRR
jgi:hypothetical protein